MSDGLAFRVLGSSSKQRIARMNNFDDWLVADMPSLVLGYCIYYAHAIRLIQIMWSYKGNSRMIA